MKRTLIGLMTAALALTASAQAPVQTNLSQNAYKGRLGLSHVRNLSDTQIQSIGKRYGAIALPTKAEAARMIENALQQRPSAAKASAKSSTIVERMSSDYVVDGTDVKLWESVEGWDGQTFNWRPAGWTHFCNFDKDTYISEATGDCPTWMAFEADGYYAPYATDGHYCLLCLYADDVLGADGTTVLAPCPEQDEWLVSNTVNNIQASNYLIFDLAFSPLYTHYFIENGQPTVDMSRIAYDVEVLVTTSTRSASNNESQYTKIFKLSDIVDEMMTGKDLNDEKVQTELMNMKWNHYKISLAEFAGKNIRMALRYKGKKGGAIMLDAIRISDMLPKALYDKPEGSFYFGFSDQAILTYQKYVLMPAYVPTTWTNYSNADSESFFWSYFVNGETGSSTEKDLVMPAAEIGSIEWPALFASAGEREDGYIGQSDVDLGAQGIAHSDYGQAKVGGDAFINYSGGYGTINFGVGNFDPTKQYWLGSLDGGTGAYAFGSGSGAWWSSTTNYAYNAVDGIANVYDAPAAPYVFNRVFLPMGDYFNLGAPIICTVYEAKDLGNGALEVTDNVLGQVSAQQENAVNGGYVLSWEFPNIMVIDTPIAISITGFSNGNVLQIAPLSQALNHDNDKGYAFVLLKNSTTSGIWWCEVASALSALVGAGNMCISHCIGMNAIFPFLHSNDGNVFEAAIAGESKTFDMNSYGDPENASESPLNGWTIESSDSWVTTELIVDRQAQKAGVKITAAELPAGVEGRTATVTVKALGCQEVITVNQGTTSGINGVTLDGVIRGNGSYNLAGQRVSSNAKGLVIVNRGGKITKVINK